MKTNEQYVDVWHYIKLTLNKYPPMFGLIFIAIYGYGHSIRKTSKAFGLTSKEVTQKVRIIKRAIRRDLKKVGANLNNISNLTGFTNVYEVLEINETEEEEV